MGLLFLLQPLFSFVPFIPVQRKVLDEIFLNLKLEENSVLYDLGCGDGTRLNLIDGRGKTLTGIDISNTAIKKAKKRLLSQLRRSSFGRV